MDKETKESALNKAVDITKCYATGGYDKMHPESVLKTLYKALLELTEDTRQ